MHDLETFLAPNSNYKVYRNAIEELNSSVNRVPILSLFLKDLFFTNDGNPKYVAMNPETAEKSLRLINFDKLLLISKKVIDFCRIQSQPHISLETDNDSRFIVNHMKSLKEQQLYKYSCLCEAKTGDGEVNLRDKWMNSEK